MTKQALVPHLNLWIEREGCVALSIWRVALLEAIAATGSISAAAIQMEIPYRVAWSKIREMERGLGIALIQTRVGGSDGGGAVLTSAADDYVRRFHQLADGLEEWVKLRFHEVFETQA
jgi:molybdate transport system regulatory protein